MVSSLGNPKEIKTEGGKETYLYSSTNQYRSHEVQFSQDTTSLVKEQIIGSEKGKLPDFIEKYGQPQAIIYGSHGTIAPGHFWGDKGLMLFANVNDGRLIEIWYFPPQSLANFLKTYPNFDTKEPSQF